MFLIIGGCVLGGCTRRDAQHAGPVTGPATPVSQTIGADNTYYEGAQPQQAQTAPAPAPAVAGKTTVKVAILLPLSGPNAAIGKAMAQAAQLAVFDVGIDHFELMPRDTGGTPEGARAAARYVLDQGAQLILGPLLAEDVRAAREVAAQRNVNVIAFSTDWSLAGGNTFMMGFMPFSQVERVTDYAAHKGYKTAALIAPNDKYGDLVTKSFEDQAGRSGIHITSRLRFAAEKYLTAEQVKTFVDGLPPETQALFLPVGGQQAEGLARALAENGVNAGKIRYLGTGLWDDPRIAAAPGLQGGWFAGPSPRQYKAFEDKYAQTYGSRPPRLASLAYDATALAAVLARTGQSQGRGPAFDRASLTGRNGFAGVDGIFRFNNDGLIERGLAILEIKNGTMAEIDSSPLTFQAVR